MDNEQVDVSVEDKLFIVPVDAPLYNWKRDRKLLFVEESKFWLARLCKTQADGVIHRGGILSSS